MVLRRLVHRWFVEYNPLYLLSAALVLRGVNLLSEGLLHGGHTLAALSIPAIAEAYAWGLIGAAALLMRVGLRRPAVMLSLLAVLYEGDLTLHTETCAYLGLAGWVAALAWLASYAGKLVVLARVMRLRVSRAAFALAVLGAMGLVLVPRVVQRLDAHDGSSLVAVWLYGILATGLWVAPRVESRETLEAWGHTVLRRAVRATWTIWGTLLLVHGAFWLSSRALDGSALVAVPPLVLARYAKGPRQIWVAAFVTLGLVALVAPSFVALAALLGAITFALHVLERRAVGEPVASLVGGAAACAYVAFWMTGFRGGVLPAHQVWLEAPYSALTVMLVWKRRVWGALVPVVANLAHHAVCARVVTAPVSSIEWGTWCIAIGFALLGGTVATTVRVHLRASPPTHPYRDADTPLR